VEQYVDDSKTLKKVSLNEELIRLKKLENLELEQEDLSRYQEHLSRSEKGFLTSSEAVDFYQQFIPFLIRELEKKKIAVDNMRIVEKKDVSAMFSAGAKTASRSVPQDIKDWLKKLEDFGCAGPEFDKLKKLLFQRDASGRLVKALPELYAIIAEFSVNELDKFKAQVDKLDSEKKTLKFSKVASLGTEETLGDTLPPEIDDRIKRLDTFDIESSRLIEFKKKILRKKPTGEFAISPKELSLKLLDFYEQEIKRGRAKWVREKKLEETIDNARGTCDKITSVHQDGPLKIFPGDMLERMKHLEDFKVNPDDFNNLKADLLKRNSNGNLIYSYTDLFNKLLDFYEKILKERSKDIDVIEKFREQNKLEFSGEVITGSKDQEDNNVKNELARREKLASEYFARSQRLEMDIKRLKERKDRAVDEFKNKSNEKFIGKLIVVLDDLERAVEASTSESASKDSLIEGVQLISRRMVSVLQREGLKPIESISGTTFDPKIHEAFEKVEHDEYPEDTIISVLRQGYWLGSKLLRPSLVRISKGSLK
jgi:molecular chaperone GrpE